jgi:hypothetical protein
MGSVSTVTHLCTQLECFDREAAEGSWYARCGRVPWLARLMPLVSPVRPAILFDEQRIHERRGRASVAGLVAD